MNASSDVRGIEDLGRDLSRLLGDSTLPPEVEEALRSLNELSGRLASNFTEMAATIATQKGRITELAATTTAQEGVRIPYGDMIWFGSMNLAAANQAIVWVLACFGRSRCQEFGSEWNFVTMGRILGMPFPHDIAIVRLILETGAWPKQGAFP